MPRPISTIPALPVAVGLAVGIGCAGFLAGNGMYTAAITAAVASLACGLAAWYLKLFFASFTLIFACVGAGLCLLRYPRALPEGVTDLDGTLVATVDKVTDKGAYYRYILTDGEYVGHRREYDRHSRSYRTTGADFAVSLGHRRIALIVYSADRPYAVGERLAVNGRIEPADAATQGPDIPYAPDYSQTLVVEGASGIMRVNPSSVRVVGGKPDTFAAFLASARAHLLDAVVTTGFDSGTTAFVLAVLAGDDIFADEDLTDRFRSLGIAHVLALSGLHTGVFIALITALFLFIQAFPGGRWAFRLIIITVVVAFAVVTGFTPSVVRAATMTVILTAAPLLRREQDTIQALFVTIAVWLVINPLWFWSPGFRLSCMAFLGVVWATYLIKRIDILNPPLYFAVSAVILPVCAMLTTSLLTIGYFHVLPLWFIPANIVSGILFSPLLMSATVAVILSAMGIPVAVLAYVTDVLYKALAESVDYLFTLAGSGTVPLFPTTLQSVLWACALAAIVTATLMERRRQAMRWGVAGVLLVALCFTGGEQHEGTMIIIPRSHSTTCIIAAEAGNVTAWCDGNEDDREKLRRQTAALCARCGADSLRLVGPETGVVFAVQGRLFRVTDRLIITDSMTATGLHYDYLVVTGSFKDNIVNAAVNCGADSVLLTRAVTRERRKQFAGELRKAGIPFRTIDERPWQLCLR